MKLNLYVFRNSTLECSGNPIFDDHEPDVFAKQLERQLMTADVDKVVKYTNTCFYHLGQFDDETMRFDLLQDPRLLLDCNVALENRKVKEAFISKAKEILESKKEGESSDGN